MISDNNNDLKRIRDEVISCQKCPLYKHRHFPVIGQGNHYASIMFIGEAPGEQEDRTGIPFCGKSGDVLNLLLKSISLERKDVYISNVIKCRPPENRDPKISEKDACADYLREQIKLINPKAICTLGRHSMAWVNEEYDLDIPNFISSCHGKVWKTDNKIIIPLYHPAVALYNRDKITTLLEDIKVLTTL